MAPVTAPTEAPKKPAETTPPTLNGAANVRTTLIDLELPTHIFHLLHAKLKCNFNQLKSCPLFSL